ncbi:hypothetical protein G4Z16_05220 [Streptomyces bathyalis]|uniref:Lipoprotein n=1 Tax=Streptomyces bathyalis TaxID=2710756 RepID=A0A7T1T3U1_9ACTN|nr:DUF6174 domain-containing protein [Streptomyces bathyalis]QPP05898.1 hypothetical protein G4Z16_05220 [Streptomyces bathyalis]
MSHAWGNARIALRAGAGATLAGALLTGCGSDYTGETEWNAPRRYSYTLESRTMVMSGSFRIHVTDGKVVRARLLGDGKRPPGRLSDWVFSVEELLKRVERARNEEAHRAEVTFDGKRRPTGVELDQHEEAADDEASYKMRDYRFE